MTQAQQEEQAQEEKEKYKIIMNAIRKRIIKEDYGRVDVVLLPHNGKSGQFFVIYTVEYIDTQYISSVKLFEGTYTISNDNTLALTVNGHTINIPLDSEKLIDEWNFNV